MSLRRTHPATRWLALLCVVPLLGGCAGFKIHDESKAQLAAQGKKAYADVKVTEVGDEEQKNLAFMLGEEIKAVRANTALQSDFAALSIANNEGPMSVTYDEAVRELRALGLPSIAAARTLLGSERTVARQRDTLKEQAEVIDQLGGGVRAPADCNSLPATDPPIADSAAQKAYRMYRDGCEKIKSLTSPPSDGRLGTAFSDWTVAQGELSKQEESKKSQLKASRDAAEAYRKAIAQNSSAQTDAAMANADLVNKEQALADTLKAVKDSGLAGTFDDSITALVDLLSAAAQGKMDNKRPDLAVAAIVLKGLPSLNTAAADFQAASTAIPVSGLLLELQRQAILADAAAKRLQLQEERIALLRAKVDANLVEVERWMRVTDALCSYAVLGVRMPHPGGACDSFKVTAAADGSANCEYQSKPIANCLLGQSWKDRLRANSDTPDQKRELYKAAGNYLQAINGQSLPRELTFREIDVRHREALLARRKAIEGWNSLVSVPLDQLNAYYAAGVKPAELGDLIVKALGLTAIAVGVAQ